MRSVNRGMVVAATVVVLAGGALAAQAAGSGVPGPDGSFTACYDVEGVLGGHDRVPEGLERTCSLERARPER